MGRAEERGAEDSGRELRGEGRAGASGRGPPGLPGRLARAFRRRLDWIRQYGSTGSERLTAVVATEAGAFLAGYAQGSFAGPSQGGYDAWVTSVDATGVRRWSEQIGVERHDEALSACADGKGGVFVAGSTLGNL